MLERFGCSGTKECVRKRSGATVFAWLRSVLVCLKVVGPPGCVQCRLVEDVQLDACLRLHAWIRALVWLCFSDPGCSKCPWVLAVSRLLGLRGG